MKFITDHNVDRFISLLEAAENDKDRSLYSRLLVAQEDMYARAEHRRDKLSSCIAECSARIKRQAKLMDTMRADGRDLNAAETLMSNLLLIHGTLSSFTSPKRS